MVNKVLIGAGVLGALFLILPNLSKDESSATRGGGGSTPNISMVGFPIGASGTESSGTKKESLASTTPTINIYESSIPTSQEVFTGDTKKQVSSGGASSGGNSGIKYTTEGQTWGTTDLIMPTGSAYMGDISGNFSVGKSLSTPTSSSAPTSSNIISNVFNTIKSFSSPFFGLNF